VGDRGVAADPNRVRVHVPRSVLFPGLFADFYRYGPEAKAPPLVCYWGGALWPSEYEARRGTNPDGLIRVVKESLPARGLSFDLVIFSAPPVDSRSFDQLRSDLRHAFIGEVLTLTPNPAPRVIGYVGYSAGAAIALSLALDLPASRRVATLGGADLTGLLVGAPRPALERLSFLSFVNDDDPIASDTWSLQNALQARGLPVAVKTGPGTHDFDQYEANGSVRFAFRWVIEGVAGLSASEHS
jgi:predicted esterase